MDWKYIVETDQIMVKDYLEQKGVSRRIRRKVRILDNIYINQRKAKNYDLLHLGDELILHFEEEVNDSFLENDIPLDIVYEDEWFMIINKPASLASQPSKKHPTDNVISALTSYFKAHQIHANIHLVNRLDYQTSGLMMIAKSGIMHYELSKIEIEKKYLCEIEGFLENKVGTIRLKISRCPAPDIRRYVSDQGKMAITEYRVLEEREHSSLVEVKLITGRTHQIRVHFSYLGHPILGDALYGNEKDGLKLHCAFLRFIHPISKEEVKMLKYPSWYKGGESCQIL